MSSLEFGDAGILGGVSQQPDATRLPNQCILQENMVPSPIDGLTRRNSAEFQKVLDAVAPTSEARVFSIRRDEDERYLLLLQDGELRAFQLEGPNGAPVGTEVTIWGDDARTAAPNWSYLKDGGGLPEAVSQIDTLTVADYTFVLNKQKQVLRDLADQDAADSVQGQGYVSINGGAYSTEYAITVTPSSGGEPESFHVFTWDGNSVSPESLTKSSYALYIAVTQTINIGDVFTYTFMDATPTLQTITHTVATSYNPLDPTEQVFIIMKDLRDQAVAKGAELVQGPFLKGLHVRLDLGATDSTYDLALANTVFPAGAFGGEQMLTDYSSNAAFVAIESANTKDIAAALATLINQSTAGPYEADVKDHVIRIYNGVGGLATGDSSGGSLIDHCFYAVNAFTELPTRCLNGYSALVKGLTLEDEDDFWATFEADAPDEFGEGKWVEGLPLYPFGSVSAIEDFSKSQLAETLPHSLRREFDGAGDPFFVWEANTWAGRTVGDDEMNPAPSFAQTTIDAMVFHRNRLGFVNGNKITFSEAGEFFNFYRTTVRQILDSDPVELESNLRDVLKFNHAVEMDGELLFFSDRQQVRLEAEPLLTPTTGSLKPILRMDVDTERVPAVVGASALVPYQRGGYSGLYEVQRLDEVNYGNVDLTEQAPAYIEGAVQEITAAPAEGQVVILTSNNKLYLYSYFTRGREKLQSAWSEIIFADAADGAQVLGVNFIESILYLMVLRGTELSLESIDFNTSRRDSGLQYHIHLDRRALVVGGTYDSGTDTTDFTVPYARPYSPVSEVIVYNTGQKLNVVADVGTTLTVDGDHAAKSVYIGQPFVSRWNPGRIMLREQTSGGQRRALLTGLTQVMGGSLNLRNSGYGKVTVTHTFNDPDVYEFTGPEIGSGMQLVGVPTVGDDEFPFFVLGASEEVSVLVSTDSHLPLALSGVEWELQRYSRHTRVSQ